MLRQEYQDIRAALSAVDEVLKNISALDQATDERELNRVLPALLESMGRYAAADRAYLFGWTDEKRLALHMTHEWCAPGVRPTMDEMQDLRMADMPNWAPRLRRGEAIVHAAAPPREGAGERAQEKISSSAPGKAWARQISTAAPLPR